MSRASVSRLYGQSSGGGLPGGDLGQRVDSAGGAAQQEIDEIVQRARKAQQT